VRAAFIATPVPIPHVELDAALPVGRWVHRLVRTIKNGGTRSLRQQNGTAGHSYTLQYIQPEHGASIHWLLPAVERETKGKVPAAQKEGETPA
jgi:hypothetical protein